MTPYSLVEHLGRSVWFSNWAEGFFVGFTAYFDASGQEETVTNRVLSVAGFVAPTEIWTEFESEWQKRLAQDHLTTFHMADCANGIEDFKTWRDTPLRRQKLLRDLTALLKPLSRKFACAVPLREYKANLETAYAEDPL